MMMMTTIRYRLNTIEKQVIWMTMPSAQDLQLSARDLTEAVCGDGSEPSTIVRDLSSLSHSYFELSRHQIYY